MLRDYTASYPCDWNQYTNALTHAYICQLHKSMSTAPLELVIFKPSDPLPLSPKWSEHQEPAKFKRMWMFWLKRRIRDTRSRLDTAQHRYKKNYDGRFRHQTKRLLSGEYVYYRLERKDPKASPRKLAPVADRPYLAK